MVRRWVAFANELASYSPQLGWMVSIRLPRRFKQERDEARLLSVAGKFGLGLSHYVKTHVWLRYDEVLDPDPVYPVRVRSSIDRNSPRRPKTPKRNSRRNHIAGKRFRWKARVRALNEVEWEIIELLLLLKGAPMCAKGQSGATEYQGKKYLIFPLPPLFNEAKDLVRLRKLTRKAGLVLAGCFFHDGRLFQRNLLLGQTLGLWIDPDEGISLLDAQVFLESMRQPAVQAQQ